MWLGHAAAATTNCLLPISRVALAQLQHPDRHCMEREQAERWRGQNRLSVSKALREGLVQSLPWGKGGGRGGAEEGNCRLQVNIKYQDSPCEN